MMVNNQYGVEIDFHAAVNLMDEELAEKIHYFIDSNCTEQEFFDYYCLEHKQKYWEDFELDKENPVW